MKIKTQYKNTNTRSSTAWTRTRVSAATAVCLFGGVTCSLANPTGPSVVAGLAEIEAQGAQLNITNTPGTIIDWNGFSIDTGEITRFIQQSASSAVLNRVTGGNISEILGDLQSNGRVFLINPNGLIVGEDAVIDTAGFVGSTLNISNDDFINFIIVLSLKLHFMEHQKTTGSTFHTSNEQSYKHSIYIFFDQPGPPTAPLTLSFNAEGL